MRGHKAIAAKRITYLLSLAAEKPELAQVAITHARRIAMKQQLPFSTKHICKACNHPAKQVRVRVRNNHLSRTCLHCNTIRRFGL